MHRQVLPFMLRRTKTEVLSDLPPKIIQDHYCELSDVQVALYNDYVSRQSDGIKSSVQVGASAACVNALRHPSIAPTTTRTKRSSRISIHKSAQNPFMDSFVHSQGAASGGGGGGEGGPGGAASSHIFQALQYLRKLANHPKLVFDAGSENHGKIAEELRR